MAKNTINKYIMYRSSKYKPVQYTVLENSRPIAWTYSVSGADRIIKLLNRSELADEIIAHFWSARTHISNMPIEVYALIDAEFDYIDKLISQYRNEFGINLNRIEIED